MADDFIKSLLLQAKEVLNNEIEMLELLLVKEKLSQLKFIAKDLWIRLTDPMRKQNIIEHLTCMACIGAIHEDKSVDSDDACAISYHTNETNQDIWELPSFSSITNWMKNLAGKVHLYEFVDIFSLWKRQIIWNAIHEVFRYINFWWLC